jgi:hypothetical protein
MYGIARVDEVVSEYDVWLDAILFPFPKMRVKVIKRDIDFLSVSNLNFLNRTSGEPDYISGLGESPEIAFKDLLKRFVSMAEEYAKDNKCVLLESNFIWSDSVDF